jgi:hypothetical protein
MTGSFFSHLDDLVEHTDAIWTHLRELFDILQKVSQSIWDREHA